MNITSIEQAALNPTNQIMVGGGVVGIANAEGIVEVVEISKPFWYEPYWAPVWEFLPWSELATVLGVPLATYGLFVIAKNTFKKKD